MTAGITKRLHHAVIFLGALLLPLSAVADQRAWSKFVMTNGERVLCVVVRVDAKSNFLVTTESSDGAIRLAKREIQTPGGISPAAGEVNILLNIIEQRMAEQDFDRVRRNMPELQKAVKQFETFLQPVIRSTYEGDAANKKAAIKAVKYYQDTTAQFAPTIETLGIANQIKQLDKQLTIGAEKYSADVLQKFIVLEKRMADITLPTPLAKRAKEEAAEILGRHLKAIGGELRETAVGRLEGLQQTAPLIAFVKELKSGDGVDQRYANELGLTLKELPPILKIYRDDVPPAVDAILSLTVDLNATQKKFKEKADVVGSMSAMLNQIKPFIYGETKAQLIALVDKELKANADVLAAANQRRDLILSIRERFRSAELALSRSQFDEAVELYRRAQTDVEAAQLPGEEITNRIQQGMQRVRILQFVHSVEQADQLEDALIDVLIKNGQRLILNGEKQLEGTGVTIGNLQKSVIKLQNYQRFRKGFNKIKAEVASDPLKAWATIAKMNSWIEENKGSLLSSAVEQWDSFSKTKLQTVLEGATQQVLSPAASVSDDERVERLREFAGYAFSRTGPEAAAVMISRGLKASNRQPYKKAVAKLVQEVVDKAVTNGDSDAALQFFQKVVETEPSIQEILGDKDMLVLLRLTKAEKMEASNPAQALAIYDDICKASPELAERRGVFRKALNLRLRDASIAITSDPASTLARYNEICKLYGSVSKDNELIAAGGQTIVDEITKLWDAGKFTEAVAAVKNNSEKYSDLMQVTDAETLVFQTLYRRANGLQAQAIRAEKPVAKVTLEALDTLMQSYPEQCKKFRLDAIMMEMRLHMASLFLLSTQTEKAMAIYEKALTAYPDLAASYYVPRKMDGIIWRYRIEKVQGPLGIKTHYDSLAFLFLLLFWPFIVSRTAFQGRAGGHKGYRFQHLGVVFGLFLLLMCFFVYGKVPFLKATLYALIPAQILFHLIGCCSYRFFPLVYAERRLAFEGVLLKLASISLGKKQRNQEPSGLAKALSTDMERLRADLPLLHDRWLVSIARARSAGEDKPERAHERFTKLLGKLDKEMIKNEAWNDHVATCRFELAKLDLRLGNTEAAFENLQEHYRRNPEHLESRELLGDLLFERGEFRAAIEHLKVILSGKGGDDHRWYQLGRCFFELNDNAAAHKCLSSVEKKDRDVYFYGARAFARRHDYKKAAKWFQTLLKMDPHDGEAIYYLASIFANQGEYDKALKTSAILKEGDEYYPNALALQGSIMLLRNKMSQAVDRFKSALATNPACMLALLGMAQIAMQKGKDKEAMSMFDGILNLDPDHYAANYFTGVLTESTDASKAILHYNRATKAPGFKGLVAGRLGTLHFFRDEFALALGHFKTALDEGEDSHWLKYVYAYTLVRQKHTDEAKLLIEQLLDSDIDEEEWTAVLGAALYSIGREFMAVNEYEAAAACFHATSSHVADDAAQKHLNQLMDECRFQSIIPLMVARRIDDAQNVILDVQAGDCSEERRHLCTFYMGLSSLLKRKWGEACAILGDLSTRFPADNRYRYHLLVAQLGAGQDNEAKATFKTLAENDKLEPFVAAGMETVKAYLKGRQNLPRDADEVLENLCANLEGVPGADYVRYRAVQSRVLFLSQLHEGDRIRKLASELPAREQAAVAYLTAVSEVANEDIQAAAASLKPHVGTAARVDSLYNTVASELALAHVSRKEFSAARDILQSMPGSALPKVAGLTAALAFSEFIKETDDPKEVKSIINSLRSFASDLTDTRFTHSLGHNLAVMMLKYCLLAEEHQLNEDIKDLWTECFEFWEDNIFDNPDYWNLEAARFAAVGESSRRFTEDEIDEINTNFRQRVFFNVFSHFTLACLKEGDDAGVQRYVELLVLAGNRTDSLNKCVSSLSKLINSELTTISKDDPVHQSWGFRIGSLVIKKTVSGVFGKADGATLEAEIQMLRQCRDSYPTPAEFTEVRRRFNTDLLGSLQDGAMGSFDSAGSVLEDLLKDIPMGLSLGANEERLRALRDYCRNPAQAANSGIDLNAEFQKLYKVVRDQSSPGAKSSMISGQAVL